MNPQFLVPQLVLQVRAETWFLKERGKCEFELELKQLSERTRPKKALLKATVTHEYMYPRVYLQCTFNSDVSMVSIKILFDKG